MSRVILRSIYNLLKSRRNGVNELNLGFYLRNHKRFFSEKYSYSNEGLIKYESFMSIKHKTKKSYLEMIDIFKARDKYLTGHVEFIYSALKHMEEFGVHKDLEVYKKLIDIFPKGKMIPRNIFQAEFMHYPKHQQCAIDLLEQMEENGVMPDWEMQDQLLNVFGTRGYPLRRYWRMMYWMPRFKKASPWLLPEHLPNDTLELAKLAIARITDVDPTTEVTVHYTKNIEASLEDTWIVSGQSPSQRDLILLLPEGNTLYVDGEQRVWLKDKSVTYFTLSTDPFRNTKSDDYDIDDVSDLLKKRNTIKTTVHESDETVILAVGSSGTSSADSMLSWVRVLTDFSPRLAQLQVLFRVTQPSTSSTHTDEIAAPQEKLDSS